MLIEGLLFSLEGKKARGKEKKGVSSLNISPRERRFSKPAHPSKKSTSSFFPERGSSSKASVGIPRKGKTVSSDLALFLLGGNDQEMDSCSVIEAPSPKAFSREGKERAPHLQTTIFKHLLTAREEVSPGSLIRANPPEL